jgi:hypothetical protein
MIEITDFHATHPLAGLLCAPRDWDRRAWMLSEAEGWVKKLWGDDRPTLVVQPEKEHPKWVLHAWLSGEALDGVSCGSHLIVTWFADSIPEDPRMSAMARVDANGGWNALAKDFDY